MGEVEFPNETESPKQIEFALIEKLAIGSGCMALISNTNRVAFLHNA